jgi:hypothetical protein
LVIAEQSSAQGLANGVAETIIYDTEITDSNSEYNAGTGVFTAALAGIYMISACATIESTTLSTNNNWFIYIWKNGATLGSAGTRPWAQQTVTMPMTSVLTTTMTLAAGDTIEIRGLVTGPSPALVNDASGNYLTIDRISG